MFDPLAEPPTPEQIEAAKLSGGGGAAPAHLSNLNPGLLSGDAGFGVPDEVGESEEFSVGNNQAAQAAKTDFNFLAALVLGEEFLFGFPAFFLTLFFLLTQFKTRVEKFAIGIPRGFAKTTFIKILCVWYILFSHKSFILIVAASEKKASAILADICDMLSSPNIKRLFGAWDAEIEKDDSTTKVFRFRGREIILWAAGAGTSVRGINRKNKRPDVMVMDDIQDREDAQNKELAESLLTWMLSTLMKARSPRGCTFIFVGNMYPQNSILEKLKNNRQWTSLIVGGLLADASSLWEDLKPAAELIDEFESDTEMGHPEVFISEVLNSTDVPLASGIDVNLIPACPEYYEEGEGEGSFILIDPSSGKKSGDDCAIMHVEVVDGKEIPNAITAGTFTPKETIKQALDMGFKKNTRLICVEDVAYQSTLLFWFEEYCRAEGIEGFEFVPVSPKGARKNDRIKKGFNRLVAGEVFLHSNIRSLVLSQYSEWNPLKINNVDELIDLVGYCEEVLQRYPELIVRNLLTSESSSNSQSLPQSAMSLPF